MNVYLSCPIRGLKVKPEMYFNDPTKVDEIVQENCDKAIKFATKVESDYRPYIKIHNPAGLDIERFIGIAYRRGYISEENILAIDCTIIDESDLVIFYNHEGEFGTGMNVEYNHTVAIGKPHIITEQYEPYLLGRLFPDLTLQNYGKEL